MKMLDEQQEYDYFVMGEEENDNDKRNNESNTKTVESAEGAIQ